MNLFLRLVYQCHDQAEADRIKLLLESRGIPCMISGEETRRVLPFALPLLGLWVYLEDQFEDAQALIKNPDHTVLSAVNIENFYEQMQEQLDEQSINSFNNRIIMHGVTLLLILLLLLTLFIYS